MTMLAFLLSLSCLTLAQEKKNMFELSFTPVISSFEKGSSIGFAVGLGWQHNFSNYFAWDILHLECSNGYEKFDLKYTGINLQTGPKLYYPLSDGISPFLALRARYGGATIDQFDSFFDHCAFGVGPEIGVKLSENFNFTIGYAYSWISTTITGTRREMYVVGEHRVPAYTSPTGYIVVKDYAYRDVSTSSTKDNSTGVFYLRIGLCF
ncbi:MAG: porin family protein [Dysgonamonadaceae bacterium]|nr:porin family protein [Dysgonamonadaceae bacterium]